MDSVTKMTENFLVIVTFWWFKSWRICQWISPEFTCKLYWWDLSNGFMSSILLLQHFPQLKQWQILFLLSNLRLFFFIINWLNHFPNLTEQHLREYTGNYNLLKPYIKCSHALCNQKKAQVLFTFDKTNEYYDLCYWHHSFILSVLGVTCLPLFMEPIGSTKKCLCRFMEIFFVVVVGETHLSRCFSRWDASSRATVCCSLRFFQM